MNEKELVKAVQLCWDVANKAYLGGQDSMKGNQDSYDPVRFHTYLALLNKLIPSAAFTVKQENSPESWQE